MGTTGISIWELLILTTPVVLVIIIVVVVRSGRKTSDE